ncbi:hypothetical protein [Streptomyces sp. NPDC058045]|uniref:hypothetical protein n=1 Tax=Streptomyces sp. NPDC058045 TaxID=3346311 RepID=UPI0036EE26C5
MSGSHGVTGVQGSAHGTRAVRGVPGRPGVRGAPEEARASGDLGGRGGTGAVDAPGGQGVPGTRSGPRAPGTRGRGSDVPDSHGVPGRPGDHDGLDHPSAPGTHGTHGAPGTHPAPGAQEPPPRLSVAGATGPARPGFPGGAVPGGDDGHGGWLDPDTADRLLDGAPLHTGHLDAAGAARLERLGRALDTLAARHRTREPAAAELPGEAVALAAFRAARTTCPPAATPSLATVAAHSADGTDNANNTADVVHLGNAPRKPARWARPARYGLAAALAGCMIGGVAVAAGTGVLPTPFGRDRTPEPGSSVSEVVTPKPLMSPTPDDTDGREKRDGSRPGTPEGSPSHGRRNPSTSPSPGTSRPGLSTRPSIDPHRGGDPVGTPSWWPRVVQACRDYRAGKPLDGDGRRELDDAARGRERVERFCDAVLADSGSYKPGLVGGQYGGASGGGSGGGSGRQGGDQGDTDGGGEGGGEDGGGNRQSVPPQSRRTAPQSTAPQSTTPESAAPQSTPPQSGESEAGTPSVDPSENTGTPGV